MTQPTIDQPEAALPGPPEPWAGSTMPEPRGGPPYRMTEMIEAEPAFAERLLARLRDDPAVAELAWAIRQAVALGASVVVSGCGTSEHGAQAATEIWREALLEAGVARSSLAAVAVQAFEAALEPVAEGIFVAISHEGGSWATNRALKAAGEAGVRTAIVTCGPGSPGAAAADVVVTTAEQDQSWCHTIGYLSPIVAALAVAGRITGRWPDGAEVRALLARGLEPERVEATERLAQALAGVARVIVVGSGADRIAARELALKIEEATYLPATMRDLETLLHGHLPATDADTGLVIILADERSAAARLARARQASNAAAVIGLRQAGLVAEPIADVIAEGLPAGSVVRVAVARGGAAPSSALAPAAAALLATAVPLQLLTERLARARGTDPDTLRRTETPYREAGERHD